MEQLVRRWNHQVLRAIDLRSDPVLFRSESKLEARWRFFGRSKCDRLPRGRRLSVEFDWRERLPDTEPLRERNWHDSRLSSRFAEWPDVSMRRRCLFAEAHNGLCIHWKDEDV